MAENKQPKTIKSILEGFDEEFGWTREGHDLQTGEIIGIERRTEMRPMREAKQYIRKEIEGLLENKKQGGDQMSDRDLRKELEGLFTYRQHGTRYMPNHKMVELLNLIRSWAGDEGVTVLEKIRQEISGMAVMGKRRDQGRERPLLVWSEIDNILLREIEEATK